MQDTERGANDRAMVSEVPGDADGGYALPELVRGREGMDCPGELR